MAGTRRHKARVTRGATIEAWAVVIMIAITWWMLSSGTLERLIDTSTAFGTAASLFAGLFYSVFATVPLAVGAFLSLAHTAPAWEIALWGGLGAGFADLVLAESMRSPLMNVLLDAVFGERNVEAIERRVSKGRWKWVSALFGAFLIAIPLPTDEEGVAFMGASRLRAWQLFVLTFAADFIGIYLLVSAASAFL